MYMHLDNYSTPAHDIVRVLVFLNTYQHDHVNAQGTRGNVTLSVSPLVATSTPAAVKPLGSQGKIQPPAATLSLVFCFPVARVKQSSLRSVTLD